MLFEFERSADFIFLSYTDKDDDPDRDRRHYHILLMCDAGIMQKVGNHSFRLTSSGHDLLEAIRDEGIWQRTKTLIAEAGGSATLEIVRQVAVGILQKQITQHTGF